MAGWQAGIEAVALACPPHLAAILVFLVCWAGQGWGDEQAAGLKIGDGLAS